MGEAFRYKVFTPLAAMKHFLCLCLPLFVLGACSQPHAPGDRVVIDSVVDAITFRTEDNDLVRLIGVRAPSAGNVVECYGKEALQTAESLIGREVRLETEPLLKQAQDGAYPRYIWLEMEAPARPQEQTGTGATASGAVAEETPEDEGPEEMLVNEKALELGTAFPVVSPQMIHGQRMLAAARYASATGRGLWGACEVSNTPTPQGNLLRTQPVAECAIKGKVLNDGRKIHRTPDCAAYGETVVLLSEGGQWFCAEDTAEDAGFARADDC